MPISTLHLVLLPVHLLSKCMYCIAGYVQRVYIFGYFEEALLFENKLFVTVFVWKWNMWIAPSWILI